MKKQLKKYEEYIILVIIILGIVIPIGLIGMITKIAGYII